MCGRFTLSAEPERVIEHFAIKNGVVLVPRYNIAPTQMVPILRTPGRLEFLTWGLRPHWLASDKQGFINARAETLEQKPSFRDSLRKRRCLVAADGFFEWQQVGKIKQPYYITIAGGAIFAFAGLWEGDTCTIITTDKHKPVIIREEDYAAWISLDSDMSTRQNILNKEFPEDFTIHPVSTTVNSVRNDSAVCIQSLQ